MIWLAGDVLLYGFLALPDGLLNFLSRGGSREIDRVLKDASPRALVRHSGSMPTRANLEWQLVLDRGALNAAVCLTHQAVSIY
jgi:hypothetical protein